MCGIAGILSKNAGSSSGGSSSSSGSDGGRKNVVPLVGSMLSCMVHRGPDGAGMVVDGGRIARSDSLEGLDYGGMAGSSAIGHTRLAIVGGTCGSQPFRSCDGRLVLEHNGEIYNYKEIRQRLEKESKSRQEGKKRRGPRHRFSTQTDSEVIVHLLEEFLQKSSLLGAIKRMVAELDGVYALAIRDEKTGETALVRDRMGVRQLYYADAGEFIAFASERKALWRIGISEPTRRVLPCSAVIISRDGSMQSFQVASPIAPRPSGKYGNSSNNSSDDDDGRSTRKKKKIAFKTMDSAVRAYEKALVASMKKRVQDFDRIGIIFSGGIDSVLVAHLAKKMVPHVTCYTCGAKGSSDIANARQIADRLGLDLRVRELDQEGVERLLPEIIRVVEDTNAGQVEVALPVYGAVGLAHRDGIRVMLTGQAADELFGGYSWYAKVAEKEGYRRLREHMVEDLLLLYKETLEREDKITMAHSIELREPFLDPEVISVAMATDLRLSVRGGRDAFGKRVHRNLACRLGIPRDIAYRLKEAAQHGSGMHGMLDAIAKKHGLDESSVPPAYVEELGLREKVGSSQRYGYLFGDEKIWTAEPHVQLYLDRVSKTKELLAAPASAGRAVR